ncbi:MAG: KH domain-containing protein [Lachnospirales bacterium]
MKELLEVIAKNIVDCPEDIKIEEITREDGTIVLKLNVNESDVGKVIGKQGRIAKSIRTIIKAYAIACNKKVFVDINVD